MMDGEVWERSKDGNEAVNVCQGECRVPPAGRFGNILLHYSEA